MNNLYLATMNIVETIHNAKCTSLYRYPFKMNISHETYLGLTVLLAVARKERNYSEETTVKIMTSWMNAKETPDWLRTKEQDDFERSCNEIGTKIIKTLNYMSADEIFSDKFVLYAGMYADYIREIQAYIAAANRAAAMR